MIYTKEQIIEIKSRVSIVSLIESLGVKLTKTGKGYKGICPFHEEKTPSLSVNEKKGVFHCFGCGASGDKITFVEKSKGSSFQESVAWLADYSGVSFSAGLSSGTKPRSLSAAALPAYAEPGEPEDDQPAFSEKEKQEALRRSVDIYQTNLAGSSDAQGYLKNIRGIHDNQVLRYFQIGFSNGNIEKRVAKDSRQYKLLQEVGILNDNGREVFKGCLVFPVVMESEIITELYARSIRDNGRVKHLYLKGPHKGVFNYKAFKVYDSVILCECIIDALSLFVQGFKNVSCLYGLSGFTDDIRAAILGADGKRIPTGAGVTVSTGTGGDGLKKIYFAFDNEDRALDKAKGYAKELPVVSKYVTLPEGINDVNDYFARHGYKADNFKELLASSVLLHNPSGDSFDYEEHLTESTVNYVFTFEEYVIEVKGVPKKDVKAPLKVGMKITYLPTNQVQYDTVDLFSSRSRSMFVNATANLFGVTREDLDKYLVDLLAFIEKRDKERVEEKQDEEIGRKRELTEEEKKLGLKLLKSRSLFRDITRDMTTLGYIGEDRNKLLAYLVGTSRKMSDPLAAIIVSRSSAGKSKLVDTVEELMPAEDVISITTASDQSFFYFKEGKLSHKLISMGEHHGMENIEYHIRELLSAKEISKVVSMKNDEGKIETVTLRAKGPIAYFMTSTNPDLNEENLSRCLILYIDESEAQTKKILEHQRLARTKKGYKSPRLIEFIKRKHRIAQRMLKNVVVRIPFAYMLDFPTRKIDARRDQDKFLNLITVISFMHQFQREESIMQIEGRDVPFIEATIDDYKLAHDLFMHGILQNTLSDLPKMARDLHKGIIGLRKKIAKEEGRKVKDVLFSRKMIVDFTGFTFVQVRTYIRVLEENEIIEVVGGYQNGQKKVYRLVSESLEDINLSMIPTPAEIIKKLGEAQS